MHKGQDEGFKPLAEACAAVGAPYFVAWRAAVAGRIATKRDRRGRWYVRPEDLKDHLTPVPVGGPAVA